MGPGPSGATWLRDTVACGAARFREPLVHFRDQSLARVITQHSRASTLLWAQVAPNEMTTPSRWSDPTPKLLPVRGDPGDLIRSMLGAAFSG